MSDRKGTLTFAERQTPEHRYLHKVAKATLVAATTMVLSISSFTANAGPAHTFTEYVPVVRVVPLYRDVTVREPQRICTPARHGNHNRHHDGRHRYNSHQYRYDNNRHHRRSNSQRVNRSHQRNSARAGEIFVGGVIGGAIGRELSRSVNGRPNAGATIAGAVIGSAVASSVVDYNHRNDSRRHYSTEHRYSTPRGKQLKHRTTNVHQARRHCTTTMQTRTERQQDGYRVTYRYRGHRYHTRTKNHPGDRLAIKVTLDPQRY